MPKTIAVEDGDSIDSIAFAEGFAPDTVWNYADNATLKELRGDRTILLAGDSVVVPDFREKTETRPTDQTHRFRRRGVPAQFRFQYLINGNPLVDEPFKLVVPGKTIAGRTDSDGVLAAYVPPDATRATLTIGDHGPIDLEIGVLEPITTDRGVKQRLANLGFPAETDGDQTEAEALEASISKFQSTEGLDATGTMDDETREALRAKHDSDSE